MPGVKKKEINAARTVLPSILDALNMLKLPITQVLDESLETILAIDRARAPTTITSCIYSTNEGLHAGHVAHVACRMMQRNHTPTPLNKGDPVVEDMRRRPAIAGAQPSCCHIALLCKGKGKKSKAKCAVAK